MIYNNPLTESNIISGEDADNFLEFCGITLFTDAIAIGEMVMDGIIGEKILAENGITLNEDHIVLEGEQAEEYSARKYKEWKDMKKEEKDKYGNGGRRGLRSGYKKRYKDADEMAKDYRMNSKAVGKVSAEANRRQSRIRNEDNLTARDMTTINAAIDGTKRHMRRHPKQYSESTIFRYSDLISE